MEIESIRLMLADVSRELLEKAKAARTDASRSGSDFEKGRHFGLYEAVSLLVQQADAFGVDRSAIGLAGVDPERDLLGDRDREPGAVGETLAGAASRQEPNGWFPLQRVVRAIGVSSPPPEGLLTPEQASTIVEQYLVDLAGLANGQFNQTKTVLAELERFALKR